MPISSLWASSAAAIPATQILKECQFIGNAAITYEDEAGDMMRINSRNLVKIMERVKVIGQTMLALVVVEHDFEGPILEIEAYPLPPFPCTVPCRSLSTCHRVRRPSPVAQLHPHPEGNQKIRDKLKANAPPACPRCPSPPLIVITPQAKEIARAQGVAKMPEAYLWGDNTAGQCGLGSLQVSQVPVAEENTKLKPFWCPSPPTLT